MNRRSPRRHARRHARARPGAQAPGRERERWSRPVSRVLYALRRDSHSSRPGVAAWLQQPTRGRRGPRQCPPIWSCSEWGLPCRTALAPYAVRSYRTLSPLPVPLRAIGGLLSVALAVGSRRPGVTWHSALWSPDFPRCACARRDCPADSAFHCNGRGPGLGNRDSEKQAEAASRFIQGLARRAADCRGELGGLRRRQFFTQDREDALPLGELRIG